MNLQDKIHHTNEMANAIQKGEAFYTMETSQIMHILLPNPQVAGTMTQQRTYAMGKAMELIETIAKSSASTDTTLSSNDKV
jgi:hypothetical protein|tara:strand:- start:409 stop:651 length:243 start_codon:yes stop_codon:yes gene_type:complete